MAPQDSEAQAQPARNLVGECIGNYRITRKLGEGGMGAVFEAVHESIGQRAAIKVLHPELSKDEKFVRRFFDEARVVTKVPHPGLVKITDFAQLPDGTLYIMMEYLEGESLWGRYSRLRSQGQWLSAGEALRITRQLASALAAVHDKGIVHRDLKPENVILVADPDTPSGERTKILDFGIAKHNAAERKTTVGMILGTPTYMAPEQCEGRPDMGDRVDVYALGVMLYEMLAGHPPFEADPMTMMRQHLFREPPPLPEGTPGPMAELVRDMLVKDAQKRPSMAQVAERVDRLGLSAWPTDPRAQAAPEVQRPSLSLTSGFEVASIRATLTRLTHEAKHRRAEIIIGVFLLGAVVWAVSLGRSTPEPVAQPTEQPAQVRPAEDAASQPAAAGSKPATGKAKRSKDGERSKRVIYTPFGRIHY